MALNPASLQATKGPKHNRDRPPGRVRILAAHGAGRKCGRILKQIQLIAGREEVASPRALKKALHIRSENLPDHTNYYCHIRDNFLVGEISPC